MKALWNKFINWLKTDNHLLWVSIIALMVIGLISVYFVGAYDSTRLGFDSGFLFNRYWPYALVGFLFMLGCSCLSKKSIIRISWVLLILGILLMLYTRIHPVIVRGALRYAFVGGLAIPPLVITLPAYITLMSHWLSKDLKRPLWSMFGMVTLTAFITLIAFTSPYVFMLQVYLLLFILLTFKARKNIPVLSKLYLFGIIGAVALCVFALLTMPHVQYRFADTFYGYSPYSQGWFSVNAIKNSALIGNTPESLRVLATLPESATDFMFAGIVAKFGILMGLLILALYGFIVKGLARIIRTTKDKFNELLATGTLGLLVFGVVMSVSAALGIWIRPTGLPFVSFMTIPLLAWCVLFGFVLSITKEEK